MKLIQCLLQLFSYSSSLSNMSGVISPTNLSLYSTPITAAPRTSARTRWNTSVILEEDFNMAAQHPSAMSNPNSDANSIILMEEGQKRDFYRMSGDHFHHLDETKF